MAKPVVTIFWTIFLVASLPALADQNMDKGREVFTQTSVPSCTICHTLSDANATGAIGPNLDELKPSFDQVRNAIDLGVGVMPAYADSLSEEELEAVSHYVSTITGE